MSKKVKESDIKNMPSGGAIIGKREGQTIIHEDGSMGGYLGGKLHKEGGIKAEVEATGQKVELQGGEIIINAVSCADTTKRPFEGEMLTNRQILSKINSESGGVSFADGGDIPNKIQTSGKKYNYGGEMMSDSEIVSKYASGGAVVNPGGTDDGPYTKETDEEALAYNEIFQENTIPGEAIVSIHNDNMECGGCIYQHNLSHDQAILSINQEPHSGNSEMYKRYAKGGPIEDADKRLKASDIPASLKPFIPDIQQKAIVGSVEHWEVLERLKSIVDKMPATYGTENITANEKIAYLHYFYGESDWYIVEKDKEKDQLQAFGYVVLNGDFEMAEFGYVSIKELNETRKVELDFYFKPITIGKIKGEIGASEIDNIEVNKEYKYQNVAKQFLKDLRESDLEGRSGTRVDLLLAAINGDSKQFEDIIESYDDGAQAARMVDGFGNSLEIGLMDGLSAEPFYKSTARLYKQIRLMYNKKGSQEKLGKEDVVNSGADEIKNELKGTTFSDGLKQQMADDFQENGVKSLYDLKGNSIGETDKNIQAAHPGFASGKYTYLQSRSIAEELHSGKNNNVQDAASKDDNFDRLIEKAKEERDFESIDNIPESTLVQVDEKLKFINSLLRETSNEYDEWHKKKVDSLVIQGGARVTLLKKTAQLESKLEGFLKKENESSEKSFETVKELPTSLKEIDLAPYLGAGMARSLSVKALDKKAGDGRAMFTQYGPQTHMLYLSDKESRDKFRANHNKALELGYKAVDYKAGKYGTAYVYEKNGKALTEEAFNDLTSISNPAPVESKKTPLEVVSVKKYKSQTKGDAYNFVRNVQTYSYAVEFSNGRTAYVNAADREEAKRFAMGETAETVKNKEEKPDANSILKTLENYKDKSINIFLNGENNAKYNENEADNYHTENLVLTAELTNDPILISAAKWVLEQREKDNGIYPETDRVNSRVRGIINVLENSESNDDNLAQNETFEYKGLVVKKRMRSHTQGEFVITKDGIHIADYDISVRSMNGKSDGRSNMFIKTDAEVKAIIDTLIEAVGTQSPMSDTFELKKKGDNLISGSAKKQSVTNADIKTLVERNGLDRNKYSAADIALLNQYEGAGGLAKEGVKGKDLFWQFFTPLEVCEKMWGLAIKYGFTFNNTNVLEPAFGSGRLFQYIPKDAKVYVRGYEIEDTAYKVSKVLFPEYDLRKESFEQMFFTGNRNVGLSGVDVFYDLVIGNPPYYDYISKFSKLGEKQATGASTFEMYFLMRGVDVLKKGGLLIYIIPASFMSNDNKYNSFKEELAKKADLVDAYRLPSGIFPNTKVTTDLIVLRKK